MALVKDDQFVMREYKLLRVMNFLLNIFSTHQTILFCAIPFFQKNLFRKYCEIEEVILTTQIHSLGLVSKLSLIHPTIRIVAISDDTYCRNVLSRSDKRDDSTLSGIIKDFALNMNHNKQGYSACSNQP